MNLVKKMFLLVVVLAGTACAHVIPVAHPEVVEGIRGQQVYVDAQRETRGPIEEFVGAAGGVVSTDRHAPVKVEVETFRRSVTRDVVHLNFFNKKKRKQVTKERIRNTIAEVRVFYRQEDGRRSKYLLRYIGEGAAPERKGSLYSSQKLAVERALDHLHGF